VVRNCNAGSFLDCRHSGNGKGNSIMRKFSNTVTGIPYNLLALAITLSLWSMAFSCNGSNYHKMVAAEHDFNLTVSGFQNAEIAEFLGGNVPNDLHNQMQLGIEDVAKGGKQLAILLQSNASPLSISSEITAIDLTLTNLLNNGVLQIKNDKTKANLQIALEAVQAVITNVSTFNAT
jgi:hypothetical protein